MFIILFLSAILTLSALTPSAAHGASDLAVITNSSSDSMAEDSPHQHNTPTFPPIKSNSAWIVEEKWCYTTCKSWWVNWKAASSLLPRVITFLSSSSSAQQVSQELGMKQLVIFLPPIARQ